MLVRGAAIAVRPDNYEAHAFDSWADLAVEPDQPCIRTATLRIRVPEVVALTRYDKVPRPSVTFTRRNLFRRDRYTCQYCGARPGSSELSIDHVVPRAHGGTSSWTNCVLACVRCNHRKADRTPRQAGMRLRAVPSEPDWRPTLRVPVGGVRQTWQKFVSDSYWDAELKP